MRFSVLGPLEVSDGDDRLSLGGGQQRKLLAILLLHENEVVPADRLIEELWNEHPPETAAKALQGHISQLRKRLGPSSLLTVSGGYALKLDSGDLDTHRLEQLLEEAGRAEPEAAAPKLREALGLWRGPPFADFAYDDFARTEIDRLEELRLTAIERLMDAEIALGRHADVVAELEALVAAHPLRERFRAQLMLALYRSGRQADALRVYQDGRALLREQLGLEPGDELRALQKGILAHEASLAAPARAAPGEARKPTHLLRRPRILAVVGIALLAGAVAALIVELTGGSSSAIPVSANSVAVLDASGKRVVDNIPVGMRPVAIAIGYGGVWVANADDGTITRLDPKTHDVVKTIGVGADVSDIAIGFGSVWVADGNDGTVTRIDPSLNAVEATLHLGRETQLLPTPVFSIAVDDAHVWATRGDDLVRIDPASDEVDRRLNVATPIGLATGGGAVWVTTLSERLLRIDPVTVTLSTATLLPTQAISPTFSESSLWVIANLGHGELERIDPNSLSSTATTFNSGPPTSLAAGSRVLWVSLVNGTISKVDVTSADVTASIYIGQNPTSLAAGDDAIWVAVAPPGTTTT